MKNIDTTTVGGRIKELRVAKGYTQEELAEIMFSNAKTISAYESNRNDVPGKVAAELAKVLDTTTDYILIGETEEDPWLREMMRISKQITDKKMREIALKQMMCFVDEK